MRADDGAAKLSRIQKHSLYWACGLLWVSGVYWLFLSSRFGPGPGDAAVPLLLELHGAAAMAFLLVFGGLLSGHLPSGWRQRRERLSGLSLAAFCGILIVSGWGLYYFGQEELRAAASTIHSVLGVVLPGLIVVHVQRARRRRFHLGVLPAHERGPSYPSDARPVASSAGR